MPFFKRVHVCFACRCRRRGKTAHLKPRVVFQKKQKSLPDHTRCADYGNFVLFHNKNLFKDKKQRGCAVIPVFRQFSATSRRLPVDSRKGINPCARYGLKEKPYLGGGALFCGLLAELPFKFLAPQYFCPSAPLNAKNFIIKYGQSKVIFRLFLILYFICALKTG